MPLNTIPPACVAPDSAFKVSDLVRVIAEFCGSSSFNFRVANWQIFDACNDYLRKQYPETFIFLELRKTNPLLKNLFIVHPDKKISLNPACFSLWIFKNRLTFNQDVYIGYRIMRGHLLIDIHPLGPTFTRSFKGLHSLRGLISDPVYLGYIEKIKFLFRNEEHSNDPKSVLNKIFKNVIVSPAVLPVYLTLVIFYRLYAVFFPKLIACQILEDSTQCFYASFMRDLYECKLIDNLYRPSESVNDLSKINKDDFPLTFEWIDFKRLEIFVLGRCRFKSNEIPSIPSLEECCIYDNKRLREKEVNVGVLLILIIIWMSVRYTFPCIIRGMTAAFYLPAEFPSVEDLKETLLFLTKPTDEKLAEKAAFLVDEEAPFLLPIKEKKSCRSLFSFFCPALLQKKHLDVKKVEREISNTCVVNIPAESEHQDLRRRRFTWL